MEGKKAATLTIFLVMLVLTVSREAPQAEGAGRDCWRVVFSQDVCKGDESDDAKCDQLCRQSRIGAGKCDGQLCYCTVC